MSENPVESGDKEGNPTKDAGHPPEKPRIAPVPENKIEAAKNSDGSRTHGKNRKRKPLSRFEIWMIVLSGTGILVAAGTGIAIVWQDIIANASLAELRNQSPELKKSADAAQSAATTADSTLKSSGESFKQEERPYLWAYSFNMSNSPVLTDAKGGEHVCADVHIANSGKTPANGVHLLRFATYGPKAERTVRAFKPPEYLTASGDMLGTTGDKWGTACTKDAVSKTIENSLLDGSVPLYVYGVVQYFDIFGEYHETGFCSQRVPKGTPFITCDGFGNWFEKRPGNGGGWHEHAKQHPGRGNPRLTP